MAKKPIPRFLVPVLGVLALAGAFAVHATRHGIPLDLKLPLDFGKPEEAKPSVLPPFEAVAQPELRTDAELLEKWQGIPIPEILPALVAGSPTGETSPGVPSFPTPEDLDPFLPGFLAENMTSPLVADDAVIIGGHLVLSKNGTSLDLPSHETRGGRRLSLADFDNDGDLDLFLARDAGLPHSLLRRSEDGGFSDITTAAGLLDFRGASQVTWVDFDRDGLLDLSLLSAESPSGPAPRVCLYRNVDGNRFREFPLPPSPDPVTSFAWMDIDEDGCPDLLTTAGGALHLRLAFPSAEVRDWRFEDATATFGLESIRGQGPLACGDLDRDGRPELIVAVDSGLSVLTRNSDGKFAGFTDITASLEITEGVSAPAALLCEDLDNDGFLDLVVAGGSAGAPTCRAWWNVGGTRFRPIPGAAGLDASQPLAWLRRLDPKGDGTAAILVVPRGEFAASIHQPTPESLAGNTAVVIAFRPGDPPTSNAIGARLEVVIRDESRTLSTLSRTVDEPEEILGLGAAIGIEKLTITWPDRAATTVTIEDLPTDERLVIGPEPTTVEPTPLPHPEVVTGKVATDPES